MWCGWLIAIVSVVGWADLAFAQAPGSLVTAAGGGSQEAEGIPATDLALDKPFGAAVDAAGNLYIADRLNNRIRRVDALTGAVTTVAGTGASGYSGDGGPATQAQINGPQAVAVDAAGNLYIADSGNRRIRRVDALTGVIATLAGTGERGFGGDGGPAADATFDEIVALAVHGQSSLYVADGINANGQGNSRVRRIELASGIITTVVGSGSPGFSGDGGPATDASLTPEGLAVDAAGNLYMADIINHRIRKVDATTNTITTVAGRGPVNFITGIGGFSGDGGPATQAHLNFPAGVAVDADGHVYISDTENNRIRAVDPASGIIVTVAGTGSPGVAGDGGRALDAQLNRPTRLDMDASGHLIIVDTFNDRIRRLVDPHFRTPVLKLLDPQIDFQRISLGDPTVRSLRIQNIGNLPLSVQNAVPDSPEFTVKSALPLDIGIGETGEIAVQFNPAQEGAVEAALTLTSNDPERTTLAVPLRGIGDVPFIGIFPDAIAFDRTFVGQTQTQSLRISNLGAGVLLVTDAAVTDTQFVIGLADTLRISSGSSGNLSVTFRPTGDGLQQAVLTLRSNDPASPALTVSLQGVSRIPKPGGFLSVGDSLGMGDTGDGFGAAWGDFDADGDPDLYVVRRLQPNLLYRNDGDRFTEIATTMGVDDSGDGSGGAWADADRDGDLDLYVTNFGQPNLLYRNDGDRFTEIAAAMGVDDPGDGYGAAWADDDRDGDPDLYVANFGPNRFYRNGGNGFVDRADSLGLDDAGSGIQPSWADYDSDGDPDLFLANSGGNRFFLNTEVGFIDVTNLAGLQESGPSFGSAWGDFDNDGDLDLCVTYFGEPNRLYVRQAGGFQDAARQFGVDDAGRGRGAVWGDFDNDGDLDLYITNSAQPNLFYRNDGEGFTEAGEAMGVHAGGDSRGVGLADYDGDGGLDIYVAVQRSADRLYQNQEANGNWLVVRPAGTESSPDAIGVRIEIVYGGARAIREIAGGASFLSQDALSAAFGVSTAESVDTLTVRWPSGIVQRLVDIQTDRVLDIVEARPLPPARIVLQAATSSLIASGQAETEILARIVDAQGELALVNLPMIFGVDLGVGAFIGGDTVQVRDGRASARFHVGQTPGTVVISARALGLLGRLTLELLPQLDPNSAVLRTVAGAGSGFAGDGGPAEDALFRLPGAVALDASGNLYIADSANNRIRRVDAETGTVHTVAGTGTSGFSTGNGGPATDAVVPNPQGVTPLPSGDLIVGEQGGHVIRRIFADTGIIDAFAGRGIVGYGGDRGPAEQANLFSPAGVAADRHGNVWIADQFNHRVRKVDENGVITTVAGSVQSGYSGDGGPATAARLNRPLAVAVDSLGRLFVADTGNHRVRMVDGNGVITTVAGAGAQGYSGDGGPGALAKLNAPGGVAVDGANHVFIADTGNHRIRSLDLVTGLIQNVAGTGLSGFNLQGGIALQVNLDTPTGLFADASGAVYLADTNNNRILELTVTFPNTPPPGPNPGGDAADFDDDGAVDFVDFLLFASAFGSADARFDLDDDGQVGFSDFLRFVQAFEQSQVPDRSVRLGQATHFRR